MGSRALSNLRTQGKLIVHFCWRGCFKRGCVPIVYFTGSLIAPCPDWFSHCNYHWQLVPLSISWWDLEIFILRGTTGLFSICSLEPWALVGLYWVSSVRFGEMKNDQFSRRRFLGWQKDSDEGPPVIQTWYSVQPCLYTWSPKPATKTCRRTSHQGPGSLQFSLFLHFRDPCWHLAHPTEMKAPSLDHLNKVLSDYFSESWKSANKMETLPHYHIQSRIILKISVNATAKGNF